ncbi:MAG: ATP-dependent DNA helicase [Nitrospirae bacterium]|nr:ATP-dependent DNA helicase [Nitrospirota bacterium]
MPEPVKTKPAQTETEQTEPQKARTPKDKNTDSNSLDVGALLGRTLSGYEHRPEQGLMALAAMRAFRKGRNLIVEAGTGVGKSLAYLSAAAVWLGEKDGRRVLVSTYTKALQRQLFEKDLPFLKRSVFSGIKYALCLGSENYLCLRRLELCRQDGLFDEHERGGFSQLLKWRSVTSKGVRHEVDVTPALWQKASREPDLCYGKDCKFYGECFYQRAKTTERQSNVLISNHHLFFANVAAGGNVLPPFEAAVFDEAHEIEDVAADYMGLEISNYRLKHLFDSILNTRGKGIVARLSNVKNTTLVDIGDALAAARETADRFFAGVAAEIGVDGPLRVRESGLPIDDTMTERLQYLGKLMEDLYALNKEDEHLRELEAIISRCSVVKGSLNTFFSRSVSDAVYWAEKSKGRVKIAVTPLNVAAILRESVFNNIDAAILTSATLSVGGDFTYIRSSLGLNDCDEVLLSSPFDYGKQALLYIPDDMPPPKYAGYAGRLAQRVLDLLRITAGSTLVLFTSYAVLNEVADTIEGQTDGIKVFRQGTMDNYRLIESFRARPGSALFGTYTFWQGVDFPGDEVRCVIITKLPFAAPTEPVLEGRLEFMAKNGRDPFNEYQVPRAVITLRQGFGRLIRKKTDTGVVAILDSRVLTKPYGKYFLDSLPKVPTTGSLSGVAGFFETIVHSAGGVIQ